MILPPNNSLERTEDSADDEFNFRLAEPLSSQPLGSQLEALGG